ASLKTSFVPSPTLHGQSTGATDNATPSSSISPPSPSQHHSKKSAEVTPKTPTPHTKRSLLPNSAILSSSLRPQLPRDLTYSVHKKPQAPPPAVKGKKSARFRDERLVEALSPLSTCSWPSPDGTPSQASAQLTGGGRSMDEEFREQMAKLDLIEAENEET